MIKAVLDTNVWVSAIIQGKMGDLLALPVTHSLEFLRCKDLVDEITGVLGRKKIVKYLSVPASQHIAMFEAATTPVKIRHQFTGCRDPKDNYLFDLAIQGKAKYIVSGDKDVIETPKVKGGDVVTFADFLRILKRGLN